MATTCPQCGANLDVGAAECKYCGERIAVAAQPSYVQQPAAPQPQQVYYAQQSAPQAGINPAWPIKNKVVAGILGILLGGLGIHKFYMGQIGMGVLYLVFCWTGIPVIVGFIEGIVYLCSNDHNFQVKHRVRLS